MAKPDPVMSDTLNVVVLAGSPRKVSYTRSLARYIGQALDQRGARVDLFDLYETPLPPLDPEARGLRPKHPDRTVETLYRLTDGADAYVLATPTYHNSYAGVLKNALDHLAIRDFRYRPVGLASHGGRSTQAVDHLRQVVRGVIGVSIPCQVCTRESDYSAAPDSAGLFRITESEILTRIDRFAEELLLFAKHLGDLRSAQEARAESVNSELARSSESRSNAVQAGQRAGRARPGARR